MGALHYDLEEEARSTITMLLYRNCSSIFWENVYSKFNDKKNVFFKLENCAKYEFFCKVLRVESRSSIDGVGRISTDVLLLSVFF